ncbi:hypothetical protein AJ80_02775 [Polytolypa hystricis UAMH7299]|uniref:Cytochrome b-c1 complex subunit 2, mitochondrial n=1 Tax=Polytolypa hystricis (strain UAMH7299) TaxID=1447883 RepID=A0A2B7YGD2_POLH7|nr:hypothetical protein AJ80_02775 [Polytolypa hystricis UAMH7299]
MLSRSCLGRNAPRLLRKQCIASNSRRGMAAAASAPRGFEYETGDAAGVKFANRDVAGPTSTLSVVAKAGSRYEPFPGYADVLKKFAFKSTAKRSALRITREVELLGGELSSYHTRENIVLTAKFLQRDLPYFAELLAEVISKAKYSRYELDEHISNLIKYTQNDILASPATQAVESAHKVAFHRGLGNPLVPSPSAPVNQYLVAEGIAGYAEGAYAKPSIAIVSNGSNTTDVAKWVGEFFAEVPTAATSSPFAPKAAQPAQYYGGEERIPSQAGNAIVIAFPGSNAFTTTGYKAEVAVLSALLGGQSTIKWSAGSSLLAKAASAFPNISVSTQNAAYADAGLLYVTISGAHAATVSSAAGAVVETLKKVAAGEVAAEDVKRATALAKFRALESAQSLYTGIELTGEGLIHGGKAFQIAQVGQAIEKVSDAQVKAAAKSLLSNKASFSAVGDLHVLPYATELGLTV